VIIYTRPLIELREKDVRAVYPLELGIKRIAFRAADADEGRVISMRTKPGATALAMTP
jgi:hypothetical protein